MKAGIELITLERQEQIAKHNYSIENDVKYNHGRYTINDEKYNNPQLAHAASQLIMQDDDVFRQHCYEDIFIPQDWDKEIWHKMLNKPYKERLIIAGALIAAEIDRLQKI